MAAGRMVGIDTTEIEIGAGRVIATFRLGAMRVIVRILPVAGVARGETLDFRNIKTKFVIYALAGRLTDALVLLLVLVLLSVEPSSASPILYAIIVLEALLTVVHTFPRHISINEEPLLTDDGRILDLVRTDRWRSWNALMSARRAWLERNSLPDADPATFPESDAGSWRLFNLACQAIALGDLDAQVEAFESLLRDHRVAPMAHAMILASLCDLVITDRHQRYLRSANRWSRTAHELLPSHPAIAYVRGALLIEMGDTGEGMAILSPLLAKENDATLRATSAAYLGKAHHHRGTHDRAGDHLIIASTLFPDHPVVKRIGEEIASDPPHR